MSGMRGKCSGSSKTYEDGVHIPPQRTIHCLLRHHSRREAFCHLHDRRRGLYTFREPLQYVNETKCELVAFANQSIFFSICNFCFVSFALLFTCNATYSGVASVGRPHAQKIVLFFPVCVWRGWGGEPPPPTRLWWRGAPMDVCL